MTEGTSAPRLDTTSATALPEETWLPAPGVLASTCPPGWVEQRTVTPPVVSPAAVSAASAGRLLRPASSGTRTPAENSKLTLVPRFTVAPASGRLLST